MNAPQSTSPRRRLQELLAIPDNQRTDAEWDELNELEISLAPGNREGAPDPNLRRPTPSTGIGGKPPRNPKPAGQHKQGGQKGGNGGGQKSGGQKGGGHQQARQQHPKPAQPQQQPQPQPQSQPQPTNPAAPAAAADAAVVAKVEDGQAKKPARKFRKRGPKKTDAGGAPAAGGSESGGQDSGGSEA